MSNNSASEFEQVVELVFQNVQYLLTVSLAPGDTLCVEAEDKSDGSWWRGDFTARYIEEITQKTGNCKKFSVFVKMLRSAILQESDSVYLDLLTYHDFEMLKNRKMRDMGPQALRSATTNNKRYLILTYTGEFDRVHYPLPLLPEVDPEPESLHRTIRRLRDELKEVKAQLHRRTDPTRHELLDDDESIRTDPDHAEIQKLREENSLLTAQLTCMEDSHRMFGFGNQMDRREDDDDERKKLQKELALTQKKCDLLFSRIEAKRKDQLQKDLKKETQLLRAKLNQLQEDLKSERSVHRKALARFARDNTSLTEQVRTLRDADKRLRVKVRESESEIDILKRRLKIQGARDIPPSRTRPRETFSVGPSTRMGGGIPNGLRKPSPTSTRTHTPTGTRRRTPPGSRPSSRPSSCPSFTNSRNQSRKEVIRGRSPGQQQRPLRAVYSRPASSMRSESPYSRKISSIGPRPVPLSASSRTASPLGSKSGRSKTSSESRHRYAHENENVSPSPIWNRDRGLQPLRGSNKGTGPASTPRGFTTDEERGLVVEQLGSRRISRASSPASVLRDVKAKLHKYARMEGYHISDIESRGTSASLKEDFHGDSSSSLGKSGRFDVMIERAYDDDDKEVVDIDSRLQALKKFLRTAKARRVQK